MTSGAQQLAADFEQVNEKLGLYPNVRILKTDGDPPDCYDIEYRVKGYKLNDDGTVGPANLHKIRITLPFGYPHFPPTVKPLTPIFHPDIDPDAIRIADFWQTNKSLADLIIHIGKMICGAFYQKDEPFNRDAFDWYEERRDWLPFDILEPVDTEDRDIDHEQVPPAPTGEQEEGRSADAAASLDASLDILLNDLFAEDQEKEEDDLTSILESEERELSGEDITPALESSEEEQPGEDITPALEFAEDEQPGEDITPALEFAEEEQPGEDITPALEFAEEEQPGEDITPALEFAEEEQPGEDLEGEGQIVDVTGEDELSFTIEEDRQQETQSDEDISLEDITGADGEGIPFALEREDEGEKDVSRDFPEETGEDLTAFADDEPFSMLTEESEGIEEDDLILTFEEISPENAIQPGTESAAGVETDHKEDGKVSVEEASFAKLELDDDVQPEQFPGKGSGKVRSIAPLVEQKKIFTAKKVLADVPDPESIPNLEELEEQITDAIARAEELFKKADKLEQDGELEKAGLTLDLVANVAVDYPGLEFARNRIRDSLLARDSKQEAQPEDGEGEEGKKAPKKKGTAKAGLKIPFKVIAIVLVLIGILAAATIVTIRDSANIKLAYSNFQQAEQLLENKEYKSAQKELENSLSALDKIIALQKDEKEKLRQKIAAIVNSQSFQEGLQGRVLYSGKYVTVDMAKNIDKFNSLMLDAETQQNSGNIEEAIKFYALAGDKAKQIGFDQQEKAIRETINSLQLKKALGEARKAEEEQEWKQAADTYAKALALSSSFSTPEDTNEIAAHLAAASFRHELMEGQKAFTASEWQKTIDMLQRAQKILEDNPLIASEAEKAEIHKLLINSQLYHILSGAKHAFEKREWELAVNQYQNAIYLLENNRKMLGEKAQDNISKIKKTILMTEIAREQSLNSQAMEQGKLQESLTSYRTIAALIENSAFREDETLRRILTDAKTRMAVLENEIRINSRVDWLSENYEEIFRKIYPSAKSSELLNPQVNFVREDGNLLIFTMSCVEKRQGSSFRLELNYQYDQAKGSWDIYSGKL